MYLKRILLAIVSFVIVVNFTPIYADAAHSYDYKKGVFDTCKSTADASNDNNLSNYVSISGSTKTIDLCSSVTVYGIYIKSTGKINSLSINNSSVFFLKTDLPAGYYPIPGGLTGNKISVSGSDLKIYEIELFTERGDADVSNVVIETTLNSAAISFNVPTFDVRTINLEVNGMTYSGNSGSVNVSNLKANTTYTANFTVLYYHSGVVTSSYSFKTLADDTPPEDVTSFSTVITNKKDVNISFVKSTATDVSHYEIYRDDTLLVDKHKTTSYKDTTTAYNTSYTYKVVAVDTSGNKSVGVSKTVKTQDDAVTNVSNLSAAIDGKKAVKLSYTFATDTSYVQIYRDNKLLVDNYKDKSYTDTTTAYNTSYTYKILAVDASGKKSSGVSKTIKTPPDIPRDATSISYTATSNSVTLKWTNTKIDGFEHVTIYRKADNLVANVRAVFASGDGYTKVSQTQNATFTDSTVEPDTKYKYLLTTTIDGSESAGTTVDVKTKKVTVENNNLDKDANGDYVLTWTAPTTGKLKVVIGGEQYKIVAAADKKVVIPADAMAYDFWGNPDIRLVPINDIGEEIGTPSVPKPGVGVESGLLPPPDAFVSSLDVASLMSVVMSLIALVGGFLLLRLALMFVPRFIVMIRNSWGR